MLTAWLHPIANRKAVLELFSVFNLKRSTAGACVVPFRDRRNLAIKLFLILSHNMKHYIQQQIISCSRFVPLRAGWKHFHATPTIHHKTGSWYLFSSSFQNMRWATPSRLFIWESPGIIHPGYLRHMRQETMIIYNIASRAAQSNSVYVSMFQISIVHSDCASKSLCQKFFFRASGNCERGEKCSDISRQ